MEVLVFDNLRKAARDGNLEEVKHLSKFVGVEESHQFPTSADRVSPLAGAVLNNRVAVARYLIEKGANVEFQHCPPDDGTRLLHVACGPRGSDDMVHVLIQGRVQVDSTNQAGTTPLIVAIRSGRTTAAQILLDAGARIDLSDRWKRTPLHHAATSSTSGKLLDLLLTQATKQQDTATDKLLNARTLHGLTPLMVAVQVNNDAAMRSLAHMGASTAGTDHLGRTALHHCCYWRLGQTGLLRRGPINERQAMTSTTLVERTMQVLLQKKPDLVEARDVNGKTALHIICQHRVPMLAKWLLERGGSNPNSTDNCGFTPLHDIVMMNDAADAAHQSSFSHLYEVLSHGGANLNAKDKCGLSPLHRATLSAGGSFFVSRLVEEQAVDVNSRDRSGRTPLHLASLEGLVDIAKILLSHGANVNAMDDKHESPLHKACQMGHLDVISLLLNCGASVVAPDNNGNLPFFHASEQGYIDVAYLCFHKAVNQRLFEM